MRCWKAGEWIVRRLVAVAATAGSRAASAAPSTSIFSQLTTPAHEVRDLSLFVLGIAATIFLTVSSLLAYALVRYRARPADTAEPPQVFGSVQIELSWTIIPILIIVVLFLATARVLFSVQDAEKPASALDVTVVGHQFWWEFRYPKYNVVSANELHVPVSSSRAPRPTFLKLTSADVMHSFWVPQLAGKTDLLPNRVNEMWIDPQKPGLYVGQCAQFCGPQHAKMLLRVYVDTPEQFVRWIAAQQKIPQALGTTAGKLASSNAPSTRVEAASAQQTPMDGGAQNGKAVFEHQACINCHAVAGTVADGRFGPDLTHLMSRDTLAAGAVANTRENLQAWIADPAQFKPGCLMPAMHLTDQQNAEIAAYLLTLK